MRRAEHEEQFTAFYLSRRAGLRRTAFLIVGDWHHAEDLTQQAMVRVYAAWPRVRPETADRYARKAVVNACLSWLRKRSEVPVAAIPETPSAQSSESVDVAAALARLAPRQRAVIALRFLDDLSVSEVAALLQISEGTVKSQTAKALATLRAQIPPVVSSEEVP